MPFPRPAQPSDRKWWVVATIGILLGSVVAIWWGLASTVGTPTWTVLGYRVIDSQAVDVTYLVSRPSGRDVTCVIRAMDQSFATVGLVEVDIPGSDTPSVKQTTRVRTTTRAVTGVIKSCTIL